MKVLVLLSLISLIVVVTGMSQNKYYCGSKLSETLAYMCQYSFEKRSGNLWEPYGPFGAGDEYGEAGWWGEAQARALGVRPKRGVVTECCDKPCSLAELLSYC